MSKRLLAIGATAALMASMFAASGASAQGQKVELCHNGHAINVSVNAEAAHIALGDTTGDCSVTGGGPGGAY